MNTQKTVYKRLFSELNKTELETHKVELGIIQDIISEFKKGQDTITSADSTLDRLVGQYEKGLKEVKEAEKLINKVKVQAKELGVDIPKDTLKIFDRVLYFVDYSSKKIKALK